MPIDLYHMPISGPCNTVILVAKALGVELNLKLVDLNAEDQLKPEFIKLNPMHCIPVLDDDGFVLLESRAMLMYLVDKYGKADDPLYPKDARQRAVVNQRCFFDVSVLYQRFADYFYPQIFANAPADAGKLKALHEAIGFLESFLSTSKWSAGEHVTIADYSLAATMRSCHIANVDLAAYPNVRRWYALCEAELSHWSLMVENSEGFRSYFAGLKK